MVSSIGGRRGRTAGDNAYANSVMMRQTKRASIARKKSPLHPIHIVTEADLMRTASQHTPLLFSFNLSNSIFIRLKIRIDINIAISYGYLLHIKDWTGRSQRSILHQFVV
jgi:hypothetical protein